MPRLSAVLVLALALPAFSQQQQAPAEQSVSVPTLRTGVRLVVVDVIVTDKNQNPIHGMKKEDFALLENNVSQDFRAFEEHTGLSSTNPEGAKMPALPPGVFTSYQPLPHDSTLNILLLDRLNTPTDSQLYMQQQINNYLKTAKRGTLTAVFGLTTKLTQLQGFTDDPEVLRAAVSGKSVSASALLEDATGGNVGGTRPSNVVEEQAYDFSGSEQVATASESVMLMKLFESETTSFQTQIRIKYTLEALNQLARYLNNFSGRKNLIWFSGSFPINVLPDMKTPGDVVSGANTGMLANPFLGVSSDEKQFRQTTALLSRDQVAVYPVLAHGLETDTNFTAARADSTGSQVRGGPSAYMKDLNAFSQGVFDSHATMNEMAQQTGGRAFVNTNDLSGAVDAAVRNGAEYYTLAYSPTDPNWNGNYRRIEVRLRQQGYNLAYRRGYFADDPNSASNNAASTGSAINSSASTAMRAALLHGGPSLGQIVFTTRIVPNSASTENTPVGNNTSKALKGPYRRLNVDVAIDPRQMLFTQLPDGRQHDTVEFLAFLYDSDGKLVDSAGSTANVNFKASLEDVAHHGGLPLHTQISVPAKGEYYLRVAVRDVQGDRVGALETPVSPLLRLPPSPAPDSAGGAQAAQPSAVPPISGPGGPPTLGPPTLGPR